MSKKRPIVLIKLPFHIPQKMCCASFHKTSSPFTVSHYLVEPIMTKHEEVGFFHCLHLDPYHPFLIPYILGHTGSNRDLHVSVRGVKGQQGMSTRRNLAQTSHSATTVLFQELREQHSRCTSICICLQ